MRDSDLTLAATSTGVRGLKDRRTGRWVWLPRLAGAAGPAADPPAGDPPAPAADPPTPPADPPADPAADPPAADPPADPPLGDPGKAALEAERKARKEAEKKAAKLEKEAQERADAELSENERLKKENEENRAKAEAATAKARNANLLTALADKGLTGGKAKAAARLLDTVEYDDEDEPTNLDTALAAAKATYGEETFAAAPPAKPSPPNLNGGAGNQPGPEPKLTAEELEWASQHGQSPQQFEEMKSVRTLEDFEAARKRLTAGQQQ